MEEIAKNITIYISHAFEIFSAEVIAAALLKLVVNYFIQRELKHSKSAV
jgi:hypothetical protein